MSGAVHLACGEASDLLRDASEPRQWLGESELERLDAIHTAARRVQFLAARWQARWLLAQVLGGSPRDWTLEAPADAPPRVRGRSELHLSISHSGERVACALAYKPVGLDLERIGRRRDIDGLVALVCAPREQAMFAGLAEREREMLFYQLWTIKEAWLKRRGEWMAPRRLAQIEAGPDPEGEFSTWLAHNCSLAVSARTVRWWTEEPELSNAWTVVDRC